MRGFSAWALGRGGGWHSISNLGCQADLQDPRLIHLREYGIPTPGPQRKCAVQSRKLSGVLPWRAVILKNSAGVSPSFSPILRRPYQDGAWGKVGPWICRDVAIKHGGREWIKDSHRCNIFTHLLHLPILLITYRFLLSSASPPAFA